MNQNAKLSPFSLISFWSIFFVCFLLNFGIANNADIEVYYEADVVQLTESTGSMPVIASVTYVLYVTNNGPDAATNLEVQINYHDEVIPTNREWSTGTWQSYKWLIPDLPAGATAQLTETSNILVPYNDKWVQASLVSLDQNDPDSTPGNWDFSEDDSDMLALLTLQCDLDLTLAVNSDEYEVYENVVYEIVVQNLGPSVATNVTAHFPLPDGMVFTSSNPTLGDYDLYSETWNIGTLDIGQTVLLNLELFTLNADGPKLAYAQVQTLDQPDPDSAPGNGISPLASEDDEAVVTIYPEGAVPADLVLSVSPTASTAQPGETVMSFFDVHNFGPEIAYSGFRVVAFLSADQNLSPDDQPVGERTIYENVFPAVTIPEIPLDVTIPSGVGAGNYYLIYFIDADDVVSETDELNNFDIFPFEVTAPQSYCTSESDFPWHEWIAEIGLTDIYNPSGKSVYSDFTAQVANVNLGQAYTFDFTAAFSYFTFDEYLRVWIDYNQDGDFEDINEMVFSRVFQAPPDGTSGITESGPIFIPGNIPTGTTRMRVSMKRGAYPEPCEILSFGEVEDYSIQVSDPGDLPNLRVAQFEIIPGGLNLCFTNPGESFLYFGGTIVNSGTIESGPFTMNVFVSKDEQLSPDDILWQSFSYSGLDPNDADGFSMTNPVPVLLEPGQYFTIMYVDPDDQVMEINELDNQQTGQIQIGAGDFIVEDIFNLPSSVPSGGTFNLDAVLRNLSAFPLDELNGAILLEVFFSEDDVFDPGTDEEIGAGTVNYNEFSNPPLFLDGIASTNLVVSLPSGIIDGEYYLFLRSANVCEQNWQNNVSVAYPILVESSPATYCASYGVFPWHDWIGQVDFVDISHTSGKAQYSDNTNMIANVFAGDSYSITLQANYSYTTFDEYWKVWIDYNQNMMFEEPEEMVFAEVLDRPVDGTPFEMIVGTIVIPEDAPSGTTRMRVSMKRGSFPSPCEIFGFGEVEDYTVSISGSSISSMTGNNEMLLMEAYAETGSTEIQWVTNTAFKNDYYVVERSEDGLQYEAILEVDNMNEGTRYASYRELDLQPRFGLNYYRIKQYFEDGSFSYSNEQCVEFDLDLGSFVLFPNPVQDKLYINLPRTNGARAIIFVQDISGRRLLEHRIETWPDHPLEFNTSTLENGIYFLSVKVDNLRLMTKRFVVENKL